MGIVLTSTFYIVSFYATQGLLGWSSIDQLPPRFKLLHARIVEPHSLAGDPGAIHLWIEAIDEENRPSGVPRAYRLPYDAKLAEKAETAVKASANGRPQGGRTADVGTKAAASYSHRYHHRACRQRMHRLNMGASSGEPR